MVIKQDAPFALGQLGQGDEFLALAGVGVAILRAFELPRHGLRVERADVASVGGVRLLTQILLISVDDSSTRGHAGELLVAGLAHVELPVVLNTCAQLRLGRLAGLRELGEGDDVLVLVSVCQQVIPIVVHVGLELLDGVDKVVCGAHGIGAVDKFGGGLSSHRKAQKLVLKNVYHLRDGVSFAAFSGGIEYRSVDNGGGIRLATFGERGVREQGSELRCGGDFGVRGNFHDRLVIPANPRPQGLAGLDGRLAGERDCESRSRRGRCAGRLEAYNLELIHKGFRKSGFPLIEQGGRLANDLSVGAGTVRPEDSLNTFRIPIRVYRIGPGGGHEKDVEALFLGGQSVPLHHDNYIFCHKAFLLLMNVRFPPGCPDAAR